MRATHLPFVSALAAALTLVPAANAQQSCTELPPSARTATVPVMLVVSLEPNGRPIATPTAAHTAGARAMLDVMRRALTAPPAELPALTPNAPFTRVDSARGLYMPSVGHDVVFTLGADGRIIGPRHGGTSVSPAADSAFVRAVAAVSDTALPTIARALGAGTRVRVHAWPVYPGMRRKPLWPETLLHERTLPLYRGTELEQLPSSGRPRYPSSMSPGQRGYAWAQFTVGIDGRVDSASIAIPFATYVEFGEAFRAWLPTARFKPKTIEGCAVKGSMLMVTSFPR